MKKKFISLITVVGVLLSLMLLQQTAMADYTLTAPTSGSGTAEDPYRIANAENLAWFAGLVNGTLTDGTAQKRSANAVLTANIDLNPGYTFNSGGTYTAGSGTLNSWTPIGTSDGDAYKGTFDGANHTISGLYIGSYESHYCGLFGYSSGTIKNINLDNSYISSTGNYVGGVCGENNYGTITNCSNSGTVTGASIVGGVCGYNKYGTITNCSNSGTVSGSYNVGGVCGYSYSGSMTNCSNSGTVSGKYYVGGVCGENHATIENCYNTGTVLGTSSVGGVCGYSSGTITNCYYLSGTADAGVGYSNGGTVSVTEKNAAQYASGEVCYLLNAGTIAWYQNISTTEKDEYPVLDSTHKQVYRNAGTYSNIEVTTQTSSKSEDADKGDYAYGYVTEINTNDCTVNSLIWNVSAAGTGGNEAEGTVTYNGNTSDLNGNIKVGLILTKTSDSAYTIESVSAYVK